MRPSAFPLAQPVSREYSNVMSRTVLVVDDQESVRREMRVTLSRAGYRVALAHDAPSALYVARRAAPDCALIDQNLANRRGDRSGLDLAERLNASFPRIRIVMFTGYASIDAAFCAGKSQAISTYLTKPASVEEIVAALEGCERTSGVHRATLADVERDQIERVLADTGGNVTRAAETLGISRSTLARKLEALR